MLPWHLPLRFGETGLALFLQVLDLIAGPEAADRHASSMWELVEDIPL